MLKPPLVNINPEQMTKKNSEIGKEIKIEKKNTISGGKINL